MSIRNKENDRHDDEYTGLLSVPAENPDGVHRTSIDANDKNNPNMDEDPRNVIYNNTTGRAHPLDNSSIFSQMFSFWINPVISQAKKGELSPEKHYDLPKMDSIESNEATLEASFIKHKSIFKAIFFAWPYRILYALILDVFAQVAIYSNALCLYFVMKCIKQMSDQHNHVDHVTEKSGGLNDKHMFAWYMCVIALLQIAEAILTNYSIFVIARLGVKIKSSVLTL